MPKVRALCSAGITQLRRSYDPVRLPSWPLPSATLRTLPSPMTGLPRLPEPPFRRAVPTTPADRAGARVDCFPRPFELSPNGTRLQPSQLPGQTARQLPDLSTIFRVESSSTGVSRLRGALPIPDILDTASL